jgi:hypothetical protein
MTISTQFVLRALLEDPTAEMYGLEIGWAAGLASGTVHPILARLEGVGWVESRWEDINPRTEGRPARRTTGSPLVEWSQPGWRWLRHTGRRACRTSGPCRIRRDRTATKSMVLPGG